MVSKTFSFPLELRRSVSSDANPIVIEGDTGNVFIVSVYDFGVSIDLTGCRIVAIFSNDAGTFAQDSELEGGGISIGGDDNNEVTIELHSGSFISGINTCELQIYSGVDFASLVTTARFGFSAKKSFLNDDTLRSDSNFPVLVQLLQRVEGLAEREQADWTEADDAKGTYIQHKPTIPSTPGEVGAAAALHAARHASGGADPVTAASIGAMAANATPTPAAHAASHAAGGTDTITPAAIGAEKARLQFADVAVAAEDWAEDTTYEDYPFRAAVALTGALATMTPEVVFGLVDAAGGNFAPIAEPYDGGVYLYAAETLEGTITIPTIILWKAVG